MMTQEQILRKLKRANAALQKLPEDTIKKPQNYHCGWSTGYNIGKISLLEELLTNENYDKYIQDKAE